MLSRCAGTGSAVTIGPWPRTPPHPKPCGIILTKRVFQPLPNPFPCQGKLSVVSAWELWWVVLITLKNVNFFKLVPSNTNYLICKPPVTEAGTGDSERRLQELGLPLLWGCAHCQKLKALIPPALGPRVRNSKLNRLAASSELLPAVPMPQRVSNVNKRSHCTLKSVYFWLLHQFLIF